MPSGIGYGEAVAIFRVEAGLTATMLEAQPPPLYVKISPLWSSLRSGRSRRCNPAELARVGWAAAAMPKVAASATDSVTAADAAMAMVVVDQTEGLVVWLRRSDTLL